MGKFLEILPDHEMESLLTQASSVTQETITQIEHFIDLRTTIPTAEVTLHWVPTTKMTLGMEVLLQSIKWILTLFLA